MSRIGQLSSHSKSHGGGPLKDEVHRRTSALIDAGRPIQLGGYLDKSQAEDLISQADWLVIPSRIESIPVVFSDAIKLSTPLIATPVGDLPELLGKYGTGVLCNSVSAEGIRDGICSALETSARACLSKADKLTQRFSLGSAIVPTLLKNGLLKDA